MTAYQLPPVPPTEGSRRLVGLQGPPAPEDVKKGAEVSPNGLHRYSLHRYWRRGSNPTPLVFVMLNPSTADHTVDDATIRKCVGFAWRLGFDGIHVVNLWAIRSRDPRAIGAALAAGKDAIGPENDAHLQNVANYCARRRGERPVALAWGGRPPGLPVDVWRERTGYVASLFAKHVPPSCFGTTKAGDPRHPLMLPYSTPLTYWSAP